MCLCFNGIAINGIAINGLRGIAINGLNVLINVIGIIGLANGHINGHPFNGANGQLSGHR